MMDTVSIYMPYFLIMFYQSMMIFWSPDNMVLQLCK
uniref:Uncharacterized protein n=1 Tax=Ciona intestinalis TaxID=7719 RepID=H2XXJ6_CIOIN